MRDQARQMRSGGASIKEIARRLQRPQSTISLWCRDVVLTPDQRAALDRRSHDPLYPGRVLGALKWRQMGLDRRAAARRSAEAEWPRLRLDPEFMFGLALYIGEGDKVGDGVCGVTNCDPGVIRAAISFLVRLGAPLENLRVQVHVHHADSVQPAMTYWGSVTGFPSCQFTRPIIAVTRASQRTKGNIQPFGTCKVRFSSVDAKQRLVRWMELALAPVG